jgi:hypothetical protein
MAEGSSCSVLQFPAAAAGCTPGQRPLSFFWITAGTTADIYETRVCPQERAGCHVARTSVAEAAGSAIAAG